MSRFFSPSPLLSFSSSASCPPAAPTSSSSSSVADLSEYLVKGCNWQDAPKSIDYVGPVFIDRTSDSRGRGLFASQNVRPGELLLVSNAFASAHNDPFCIELFSKIVSLAQDSPISLRQLYSLAGSNSSSHSMPVPPLSLFHPSSIAAPQKEAQEELQFDEKRLMHIMQINSFEGAISSPKSLPVTKLTGLWLLPSFINHSCSPNAARLVAGEAMFIHAATDIQANEEITLAYTDVMSPLKRREEALQKMGLGFSCECKRCFAERSVKQFLQEVSQRFHSLFDKAAEEVHAAASAKEGPSRDSFPACTELAATFGILRKEMTSVGSLSELQKQWILAGYSSAFLGKWLVTGYSTGFANASNFVNSTALELVQAMRLTVPGMQRTLTFATLLASLARRDEENLALFHRLLHLAMDECTRVYGKQKPEVTMELMEQASTFVPFF